MWLLRSFWKWSLQLTSLLHEDKELIQKLLSLWVVVQFVKLEIEEWTQSACGFTVLYQMKLRTEKKKNDQGGFCVTLWRSWRFRKMKWTDLSKVPGRLSSHFPSVSLLGPDGATFLQTHTHKQANTGMLHHAKRSYLKPLVGYLFLFWTPPTQRTQVLQLHSYTFFQVPALCEAAEHWRGFLHH